MRTSKCTFLWLPLAVLFVMPAQKAFGVEKEWDELDLKATQLFQEKKFDEALPVAEEALLLAEKKYGLKSPQRLVSMNFVAYLSKKAGDYARAQVLYGEVLGLLEKIYGPDDSRAVAARQRYEAVVSLAKEESPR